MSYKSTEKKISPFVIKLITILDDPESKGSIQWVSPQAFCIVESESFSKKILPKYYKHHNMSSFIRQLNIYGFTKLKISGQDHTYCNPNFIKNNKKLLKNIQRRSNNKSDSLKSSAQESSSFQNNSTMMKSLTALKNQNKQYRLRNKAIQEQINKLTQQRKKQVENITNYFSYFVDNNFNTEESMSNTSQKQEQLYRNVVETLEHIRSFKGQNFAKDDQRIQKIIAYLSEKKVQLQSKIQNIKNQKKQQQMENQLSQKQYIEKDQKLILFQSQQYYNCPGQLDDPMFQFPQNQSQYFLDNNIF